MMNARKNFSHGAMVSSYDKWAGWAAIALGFSIPISTALDEMLLSVLLALWFLGGHFRKKMSDALKNPIVVPALMLLGMYLLGLSYGNASWLEALGSLKKAANLLLIPVMIPFLNDGKTRRLAMGGFLAAICLTMLLSYLIWLGIITPSHILKGDHNDPVAFKLRITHSFLMAYGAYLFLLKARWSTNREMSILNWALAAAALFNVFFMTGSKTGYLVASALCIYFIVSQWGWRGAGVAMLLLLILTGIVYNLPSSAPHQRVSLMFKEAMNWRPGQSDHTSSTGDRLEFMTNSLRLIRGNPVWGAGTGGFKGAYAELVKGTKMDPSDNPHNEYLMVTVQTGAVGLVLLLWLFTVQWQKAALLPDRFDWLAARGLIILIMSASLVTSTLIDHTEGLFYVWMSALLFAGWKSTGAQETKPCRSPLS
jgi:O-antigen ligase